MAYQTLLTHLPSEQGIENVLRLSVALAEAHQAHLFGLHVIPRIDLQFSYELPVSVTKQFEIHRRELASRIKAKFESAVASSQCVSEFRTLDGQDRATEELLVEQGNATDLILLGLDPDKNQRGSRSSLSARVLAGSGRALVLVPPGTETSSIGRRVMIAWDGKRAATRALVGAIPLLARADAVRLQHLRTAHDDAHEIVDSTAELADTLKLHDIEVEVERADVHVSEVGRELLRYASDWDADVMVAGSQEQAVWRERLFGSSTRYLLENSPIPLMMSS